MPYGKKKVHGKVVVYVKHSGQILGTHNSEAAANRQLAAIHANEGKKKKHGK